MLTVYYGDMQESIYNTAVYFKNTYLDAWIEDGFAKQAIKAVVFAIHCKIGKTVPKTVFKIPK